MTTTDFDVKPGSSASENQCSANADTAAAEQLAMTAPSREGDEVDGAVATTGSVATAAPLVIVVHGLPAPQGSKRHVGNGVMIESSKKVKPWRQDVVAAALEVIESYGWTWETLDGCLHVRMVFSFTRPKSHYRTGRNAHLLRADAPAQPQGTPDLDKLARSTCDALTTAGAWKDDARVVEYDRLAKVYVGEDVEALATTGARIEIRQAYR